MVGRGGPISTYKPMPKVTPEGLEVRAALLRAQLAEAPVERRDELEWLIDWAERTAKELRLETG